MVVSSHVKEIKIPTAPPKRKTYVSLVSLTLERSFPAALSSVLQGHCKNAVLLSFHLRGWSEIKNWISQLQDLPSV